MGRRIKILKVSRELLAEMFRRDETDGRQVRFEGMPEDAVIVGFTDATDEAFTRDQIWFRVESAEFPESMPDCMVMDLNLQITVSRPEFDPSDVELMLEPEVLEYDGDPDEGDLDVFHEMVMAEGTVTGEMQWSLPDEIDYDALGVNKNEPVYLKAKSLIFPGQYFHLESELPSNEQAVKDTLKLTGEVKLLEEKDKSYQSLNETLQHLGEMAASPIEDEKFPPSLVETNQALKGFIGETAAELSRKIEELERARYSAFKKTCDATSALAMSKNDFLEKLGDSPPPEEQRQRAQRSALEVFAWETRHRYSHTVDGVPNSQQSSTEFVKQLAAHLEKHEVAYIYKVFNAVGGLTEIWLLDPLSTVWREGVSSVDLPHWRTKNPAYPLCVIDLSPEQVDVIKLPLPTKDPSQKREIDPPLPPETIRRNNLVDFAWDTRFAYAIAGNPNAKQDNKTFVAELISHLEKYGIAHIWKILNADSGLSEIWLLDPFATKLNHWPSGEYYEVRDLFYGNGQYTLLPIEQVDVIRRPDELLAAKQPTLPILDSSKQKFVDIPDLEKVGQRRQLWQMAERALAASGVSHTCRPNQNSDGQKFCEDVVKELETHGVCYLWKKTCDAVAVGDKQGWPELYVLPTEQLTPYPATAICPEGYYQWSDNRKPLNSLNVGVFLIDAREVTKLTNPFFVTKETLYRNETGQVRQGSYKPLFTINKSAGS